MSRTPPHILSRRAEQEREGVEIGRHAPRMASEEAGILQAGGQSIPTLTVTPQAPEHARPHVFVHGGAWLSGSSRASIGLLRRMAQQCRRPILSLDYPLAPEHPFPAAIDATEAALSHLAAGGGMAGVIAGSAGCHIAVAAAIRLHASGGPALPGGMLLWNPALGQRSDSWSHAAFGSGFGLTTALMREAQALYAVPAGDPFGDVARMPLAGLPPVWIACGDRDPLLEDSLQLFARLAEQGGTAHLEVVPGAIHGFANRWFEDPRADAAVTAAMDWLESTCRPA